MGPYISGKSNQELVMVREGKNMTYVIFENPGTLDSRALTVMGLNAKENDNPIGYFGTGFKYGIAIALRNGCDVIIQNGMGCDQVVKQVEQEFRGKKYMSVWLDNFELPFTTELGKNWFLWQAYREFKGNCDDEGGKIWVTTTIPIRESNKTRVIVSGDSFLKVHDDRDKYFWNEATAVMLDESNSRSLTNPGGLFYRGIKVGDTIKETNYSYNIIDTMLELSEDRTLTNYGMLQIKYRLTNLIASSEDEALIEEFVCCRNSEQFECVNNILAISGSTFNKVVERIYTTRPERLQEGILESMRKKKGLDTSYSSLPLTPLDVEERDKALALIEPLGLDLQKVRIIWKADLGEALLGCTTRNEIYIGKRCFDDGAKVIAATIIEEYIHAVDDIKDYTRTFQDRLLRMLVNVLAEKQVDDYNLDGEIPF